MTVEWVSAQNFTAEYLAPGCDVLGTIITDHAVVIASFLGEDCAAIHGTPKELRAAAQKILAALAGEPEQPEIHCHECGDPASSVDERGMCPDCASEADALAKVGGTR